MFVGKDTEGSELVEWGRASFQTSKFQLTFFPETWGRGGGGGGVIPAPLDTVLTAVS